MPKQSAFSESMPLREVFVFSGSPQLHDVRRFTCLNLDFLDLHVYLLHPSIVPTTFSFVLIIYFVIFKDRVDAWFY